MPDPRETAFERAFRAERAALVASCFRRVDDRELARDLTAEVFRIAWRHWDETRRSDRAWLFGVARNLIGNEYRGCASGQPLPLLDVDAYGIGADTSFAAVDLRASLASLPPAQQEVLRLTWWDGLAAAEVAEVLGVTAGRAHAAGAPPGTAADRGAALRRGLDRRRRHRRGTGARPAGDAVPAADGRSRADDRSVGVEPRRALQPLGVRARLPCHHRRCPGGDRAEGGVTSQIVPRMPAERALPSTIETERLRLRPWRGEDAGPLRRVAADAAGFPRLWSTVRAWNTASRGVMRKIGLVESGRLERDPVRGDSLWYVRDRPVG